MAQQIIVSGKLDYADGQYLIRDDETHKMRQLGYHIGAYIGKRIVVSAEEPEKELDPVIDERLQKVLVNA